MSIDRIGPSMPLVVVRWRRYGHERAYLKRGDEDLGYRNLVTGEVVCSGPGGASEVATATADLYERVQATRYRPKHAQDDGSPTAAEQAPQAPAARTDHKSAPPPSASAASVAPSAQTTGPSLPDRDLALNVPGQSARAQAVALRNAAPIHTFVARALGIKTDERNWRIGADGEAKIARHLDWLPAGWCRLFAIPIGENGSDIDALLIGPGGVFTVNAKHHPQASVWVRGDTVKVNGTTQCYVRNSRHEAGRAARLLSTAARFDVEVRGIVAFTGHRAFRIKEQPADGVVTVLEAGDLAAHLSAVPTVLGAPSTNRIYEVARHLATWQPKTVRRDEFDR